MRADLAERLRVTLRGKSTAESGVTGVTGVTGRFGYALKNPELRQLRQLRVENSNSGKGVLSGVTGAVTAPLKSGDADIHAAIDERAGMAADSVPTVYLDAWAVLNCQRPAPVSDATWRQALDDGGLFLDAWGKEATEWEWLASDLFDVPTVGKPGGLIWRMGGRTVEAFGPEHARFDDGEWFDRKASE